MTDYPLTAKARTMQRLHARFNPVSWHCRRCAAYLRPEEKNDGLCRHCNPRKKGVSFRNVRMDKSPNT